MSVLSNARKEVTTCDFCGEKVTLPPGVFFRGERLHRQCAARRKRETISEEQMDPLLNRQHDLLEDLVDA